MSSTVDAMAAARSEAARTPLMRQYLATKAEHPDAFVFFRLGDFYELFFEDAVEVSRLLGLTLTSRNKQDPNPIPMCGIPWHQRDAYVGRLLRAGHKVAICDQLEDPSQAKGLVQRGVTEILTPGSVTHDQFIDGSAHNFLAALLPTEDQLGICLADASTGEVRLLQAGWDEGAAALSRVRVSEWLTPDSCDAALSERLDRVLTAGDAARSRSAAAHWVTQDTLAQRWPAAVRQAHADVPLALRAANAALAYLDRSQGGAALQMTRVERWQEDSTLRYDAATARHLEIFAPQPGGEARHTLWAHVDLTRTAPGARRLRGWIERPLVSVAAIQSRQDRIAAWLSPESARPSFRESLRGMPDLERLTARVACGKATPRDLAAVRDLLGRLPDLVAGLSALGDEGVAAREALTLPPMILDRLARALVEDPPVASREGGIVRSGYDPVRDDLHALSHSGKQWIAELETSERERTGISTLKVGYNKVFGYFLEVTHAHRDKVPGDWERRQTLTNAERYVTPALKQRESEVLGAEDRLRAREHEIFIELREFLADHTLLLQRAADTLGILDAEASLAELAQRSGWTRPVVEDSDRLELIGSRHPVVERLLPRGEFVPNDVRLSSGERQLLLLTGPNMGGKSTYLRQIALSVLLAQAGSWVPADRATIGVVDRLFTRVGAADRLGAGQSTFMVEMSETAEILRSATARSVVLLDEIGRGTATYDGLALAWAVTEFLHDAAGPRPRTVFATHYHELTQLTDSLPRLVNVQVAVEEWGEGVIFLHRITEGAADRSYGIHVARLAGLPPRVLQRAGEVLRELERGRAPGSGPVSRQKQRSAPASLPLFESAPPDPVLAELDALDPNALTPLEALQRIAQWKRQRST